MRHPLEWRILGSPSALCQQASSEIPPNRCACRPAPLRYSGIKTYILFYEKDLAWPLTPLGPARILKYFRRAGRLRPRRKAVPGRKGIVMETLHVRDGTQAPDANDLTNPLTETEERNLATVAAVLPYWNSHDVPRILSYYHDDIVWHNVAMQEVYRGKQQVGAYLEDLFRALPDLALDMGLRTARGKHVAEEYVIRGTHRGPLVGVPPTGRFLQIPCVSMLEMRDGKFFKDHFYYDSGLVLRQMGLLPSLEWNKSRFGRLCLWLAAKTRRKPKGPPKPLLS
jgi:steroid delta-isomerase-like uncharacterized protein